MLYALGAVLLWSTVATAFKLTLRSLSSTELVWWASVVSFLLLGLMVILTGRMQEALRLWRVRWRTILFLGAINPFVYYLTLFRAYELLPAQEAQAINYTWALVLAFLSVPILGHRLSRYDLLAGAFGYFGVLIIATRGDLLSLHFGDPLGVALALTSTVLWALYWIINTRMEGESMVVLMGAFGVGIVLMGFYLLYRGIPLSVPSLPGALGALYVGMVEMSVTFVLWGNALKLTSHLASVSNLIFLSPILSLVLIHVIAGERIYPSTMVALGFILIGLLIQQRGGRIAG